MPVIAAAALSDGLETGEDQVSHDTDLPLPGLLNASPWSLARALDPARLRDIHGGLGIRPDLSLRTLQAEGCT